MPRAYKDPTADIAIGRVAGEERRKARQHPHYNRVVHFTIPQPVPLPDIDSYTDRYTDSHMTTEGGAHEDRNAH